MYCQPYKTAGYPDWFKIEVVNFWLCCNNKNETMRQYGVTKVSLNAWIKKFSPCIESSKNVSITNSFSTSSLKEAKEKAERILSLLAQLEAEGIKVA